jgi:dihydroneopterin aldolase
LDIIFIQSLKTQAVIGVYDFEKVEAQPLIFDLEMGLDLLQAMQSDDLEDTVDYAKVCDHIDHWLENHQFELLEAMLEALIKSLWQEFAAIQTLKVRVQKPNAVKNATVGLEVYRTRPEQV